MYGLNQSAIIAYNQLIYHMEPHRCYPSLFTTGLWAHKTRFCFFFCVGDFGVKYFSKDDANHLLNCLKKNYAISTDWEGRNYLGLTIYWNYSEECIDISMPDYVRKALDSLQYAPHRWSVPAYGKRLQMEP